MTPLLFFSSSDNAYSNTSPAKITERPAKKREIKKDGLCFPLYSKLRAHSSTDSSLLSPGCPMHSGLETLSPIGESTSNSLICVLNIIAMSGSLEM